MLFVNGSAITALLLSLIEPMSAQRPGEDLYDRLFGSNELIKVISLPREGYGIAQQDDNRPEAVETWTGGDNNDSNWTSNGNWSGIGGAGANDDLVFPASAARKTNTNNFSVNTSFRTLTFTGNGYNVSGNQIILTNGMTINPGGAGAPPIFGPGIVLNGNQTFNSANSNLELNGAVNLNGHTLTLNGAGNHRFDGQVLNSNPIVGNHVSKQGAGTAFFNGNNPVSPNIVAVVGAVRVGGTLGSTDGTIFLEGGRLEGTGTVGRIFGNNALSAGSIAPGNGGNTAGLLTSLRNSEIGDSVTIAIDLNGTTSPSYDRINFSGASLALNGAVLNVSLGFTPTAGNTFTIITGSSISGQFAQGNQIVVNNHLFNITYNSTSVVLTSQGPITALTWDGGGSTNNWSEAANWNPNAAPIDGIDLIFPAGVPADSLANTNNIAGLDVGSITITGGGYQISGNAVTLADGFTSNIASGNPSSSFGPNITLVNQSQTFANSGAVTINLTGSLNLNGRNLVADGTGLLLIHGVVSGAGGITKNGLGQLQLSANNTYTGTSQVNAGRLAARSTDALGASGAGNQTIVSSGATLQIAANSVNIPETISIIGNGINGVGAINTNSCAPGCSLLGPITLDGNASIGLAAAGEILTIGGGVSGSASLTKIGTGTLILPSANTYTGTTQVNAGILRIANATALGASGAASNTIVADGATLEIANNTTALNETLTLNGSGVSSTGALRSSGCSAQCSFSGAITLASNASIGSATGEILVLNGAVGEGGGARSLTKIGPGTLTLAASNTYSGQTTVNEGTLLATNPFAFTDDVVVGDGIGGPNADVLRLQTTLNSNDSMTINSSGRLDLVGGPQNIANLSGNGNITYSNDSLLTLFQSTTSTFSGVISGSQGTLSKNGSGTLVLSGANTYTGTTLVTNGTLLVNGILPSPTTLSVGILGGTGTIGSITGSNDPNGILSPGTSPGTLNVTGNLTLNANKFVHIEVNGTTPGTQYDPGMAAVRIITGQPPLTGSEILLQLLVTASSFRRRPLN